MLLNLEYWKWKLELLNMSLLNIVAVKHVLQADICPLMASLIGVPIPLQSVVRNLSVPLCRLIDLLGLAARGWITTYTYRHTYNKKARPIH